MCWLTGGGPRPVDDFAWNQRSWRYDAFPFGAAGLWEDGNWPRALVTFPNRTPARGSLTLELPDRRLYTRDCPTSRPKRRRWTTLDQYSPWAAMGMNWLVGRLRGWSNSTTATGLQHDCRILRLWSSVDRHLSGESSRSSSVRGSG